MRVSGNRTKQQSLDAKNHIHFVTRYVALEEDFGIWHRVEAIARQTFRSLLSTAKTTRPTCRAN